jgi:hypothetical protein
MTLATDIIQPGQPVSVCADYEEGAVGRTDRAESPQAKTMGLPPGK